MSTPLRELKLQPEALADSGKGPSMFSSLTPYLRRLELKVRILASQLGCLPRAQMLRGTEGPSWNVINNDNEVFHFRDIHLQLFRPTERCPGVVKTNPLRTHTSI